MALPSVKTEPSGRAPPEALQPENAEVKRAERIQQAVFAGIERVMAASGSSWKAISKFKARFELVPGLQIGLMMVTIHQNSEGLMAALSRRMYARSTV